MALSEAAWRRAGRFVSAAFLAAAALEIVGQRVWAVMPGSESLLRLGGEAVMVLGVVWRGFRMLRAERGRRAVEVALGACWTAYRCWTA